MICNLKNQTWRTIVLFLHQIIQTTPLINEFKEITFTEYFKQYHPIWKSRRLAAADLSSILSELASAHSQSTTNPMFPPCLSWNSK